MQNSESTMLSSPSAVAIREAVVGDEKQLYRLEQSCFETDRLSLRRLKHWVRAGHRVFLVAELGGEIIAYGLVLLHKGTQLARLYSLAVDSRARGKGVGKQLLTALEDQASELGKLYMRLEVASDNTSAIALYHACGYREFSWLEDYYEDHRDAIRMQKRIRHIPESLLKQPVPWYQQTTEFTCGPAALMMAMSSLQPDRAMTQDEELDIWREATTIFMTSGHGGSHPIGLGLAARKRGFNVEIYMNQKGALFIDGVRSEHKKEIVSLVDSQFRRKARQLKVGIRIKDFTQDDIENWLDRGSAVLALISTYRIDGRKAPHWVAVSGIDNECLYVHDPDPADEKFNAFDCQYIPIARTDFAKMSVFGKTKLRTGIVISKEHVKG